MSQRPNHRRGEDRHQDNGPRWESHTPNAGCNSTHVARARRGWQNLMRRVFRRKAKQEKLDLTHNPMAVDECIYPMPRDPEIEAAIDLYEDGVRLDDADELLEQHGFLEPLKGKIKMT